jgi:hypothetical protein
LFTTIGDTRTEMDIKESAEHLDGRDATRHVVAPMHFDDDEAALRRACALLSAG